MAKKRKSPEEGGASTAVAVRGKTEMSVPKAGKISAAERRQLRDIQINPGALIAVAMQKGMSAEYLHELLAMRKEIEAERSRRRFFEDLAQFQAECPIIEKKAEARDPNRGTPEERALGGLLLYLYAPYEDIAEVAQPIASKWGFSATVRAKTEDGKVTATCILRHREGHVEETSFTVPIGEGTKLMSPMQKVAAARSFARRYAYIDALGLAMKGEDVEAPANEEGFPLKQPGAVAGAQVSKEGVLSGGGKPAAGKNLSQQPDGRDPSVPSLKEARLALQRTMDLMYQVYDSDMKPMKNPDGSVMTEFPSKGHPGAPFTRLFTLKELEDHWNYGKKSGADGEDAAKLVDINLDWIAGLAERRAVRGA